MHFTREPILESIISARDGQKISIRRSSVQANEVVSEEFIVDSVEVVSFGGNLFYRSLEKPKPFMLPASHYELVEVKETRIVLKSANLEKSIKIGGGKEQPRQPKEVIPETLVDEIGQEVVAGEEGLPKAENVQHSVEMSPRGERKRDRRKRRRGRDDRDWQDRGQQQGQSNQQAQDENAPRQHEQRQHQGGQNQSTSAPSSASAESVMVDAAGAVIPPVIPFATLIPPPTTLISETLSRYKEVMFGEMNSSNKADKASSPKEEPVMIDIEEVIYEEKKPEADENNASDEPLTRLRLDESYFDQGGFGPKY